MGCRAPVQGPRLAIVEAKSQGSSLAKKFNDRVEEAIGQAADVWKSHERGLLISDIRPWIGYLMIVEETPKTIEPKHLLGGKTVPAGVQIDPTFGRMSYAERYAMAFKRLDQERMLDATCVAITSGPDAYAYPNDWLSFDGFVAQLWGRCQECSQFLGSRPTQRRRRGGHRRDTNWVYPTRFPNQQVRGLGIWWGFDR